MNSSLKIPISLIILIVSSVSLFAQDFNVSYTFAVANNTSGRTDPTPPPVVEGLTFGNFIAVSPAGNPNNMGANPNAGGRFSFTGWPRGATTGSDAFTGSLNTDQYYEVTIIPETYYLLKIDTIRFTIQRSGTGIRQYAVRWSVDNYAANLKSVVSPFNENLQITGSNIFQVNDASTTAQQGSLVDLSDLSPVTTPITFRFYGWNAEAAAGTFSIDNVALKGTSTLSPTAPIISISVPSLIFPATPANMVSEPLSYTVQANNLTEPLIITAAAPFAIAASPGGPYETSLSIPAAMAANPTTIFVKFAPTEVLSYAGVITHASSGATIRNLALSGDGVDPVNVVFNFNTCTPGSTPGSGFISYSVSGAQKWACSSFGFNQTTGVDMNGFSNGPIDNEDWLISPQLNLENLELPVLRFRSRGEFVGPPLQLLISTDYDGSSNPNTATWTNLNAEFPPLINSWTLTDGIDLSGYKSFPKVFIAFKYTSSIELGASRWSLDDLDITNRTQLLTAIPSLLNFGEISTGNVSASQSFTANMIGYGNVTLTAPSGYELSVDNVSFSNTLVIPDGPSTSEVILYARFKPGTKALKIEGKIKFSGEGLDSSLVTLTGTSYPRAETFDAGTYNLSFFGSSPTNSTTPEKIANQVNNIASVLQKLNLDVVGVEEVSNDDAFNAMVAKLPNKKAILSTRWSYSFNSPDSTFPPQKTGFVYDSLTMHLVEAHTMFTSLYDSARNGYPQKLPGYPGGAINFWAAGRLPFLATFDATINGVTKRLTVIDIHAKSSSDAASYSRRLYDVKVLLDTLNAYYKNDNLIIVGDYNDRVIGSTYAGSASPFKGFVDDAGNYTALTLPLDEAGKITYLGGSAMIDHLIVSNELAGFYIDSSTVIEDPRAYINGYNASTASDHLPVYSRFNFSTSLPVTWMNFYALVQNKQVLLKWITATELNNSYFEMERSVDQQHYTPIAKVKGNGSSVVVNHYEAFDSTPLPGINYYRLKQVDLDGNYTYSKVLAIQFSLAEAGAISLYPNPVVNKVTITVKSRTTNLTSKLIDLNGRIILSMKGNINLINQQLNSRLGAVKPGMYLLQLSDAEQSSIIKFIKK